MLVTNSRMGKAVELLKKGRGRCEVKMGIIRLGYSLRFKRLVVALVGFACGVHVCWR